ncbi:MAG: pyridoxamine 5'-phosphate oxidase family protein [Patescibacteria group bacterium]
MATYTKQDILRFLKEQSFMTLATVSPDGAPHVVVLLYAVDDDLSIYFMTHEDSRKAANLSASNTVSLVVWEHKKMSVQIEGTAEAITDEQKKDAVLGALAEAGAKREDFWPPIFRIRGGAYAVFRIKPNRIRCLDLAGDHMNEYHTPFTDLDISV